MASRREKTCRYNKAHVQVSKNSKACFAKWNFGGNSFSVFVLFLPHLFLLVHAMSLCHMRNTWTCWERGGTSSRNAILVTSNSGILTLPCVIVKSTGRSIFFAVEIALFIRPEPNFGQSTLVTQGRGQ